MSQENAYLVFMLKNRSGVAFRTIYERYFSRIQGYCSEYVSERSIAQEMTQDTFVKLWEKIDSLPNDTNLQALLYCMARNNCLNYLKHLKVTEKYQQFQSYRQSEIELNIYALADLSAQMIISEELETRIREVTDNLPPMCRKVFELSRWEEKSYREIAETLGIAVKTVENQIQKALKVMRKELKDYLPFLILIQFLSS